MKYRKLGKTGQKVSVVGVGTWQFGGEWGRSYAQNEADAILDAAAESGVNLLDTAECYGDHLSETLIGDYLRRRTRSDWFVATKFGHKFHNRFERTDQISADEVLRQLDESLKALQTEYIDLYQFHSLSDEQFANDALWTMLNKQMEAGKIRHLGISIGSNTNIYQTDAAAKVGASVIQVVYNRIDREPEQDVFPSCIRQNLGVLARVPLASGFLSGKYAPGAQFAKTDVRSRRDSKRVNEMLQLVEQIRRDEVPAAMEMATWALAWCLRHPAVTCVIPGCKTPEQTRANAAAADYAGDEHPQAWPDENNFDELQLD